ncbi:trypsin-like peptidase domain-containing protein [Actinoplanes sp. NPDC026619]|uniref:S1C family serine protease n=1 Tax=Actinoplanes sp. NPDC026619 TaxID=3155798 RepID=UPI0033E61B69
MTTPEQFTYPPDYATWPPYQQPYQASPPPPRRRRTGRLVAAIGGGVVALALVGAGGFALGWAAHPSSSAVSSGSSSYLPFNPGTGSDIAPGLGSGSGSGSGSTGDGSTGDGSTGSSSAGATDSQVAAVAAKVDPALVDIDTVLGAQNAAAAGTGIVISADGVVLTNNHVVAGATSITVTDIGNGKSYRAAVVGYDRSGDVAVLRLSGASGLATATLATSAVQAGDSVVAIGNAGGTGGTPSAVGGVVSALNQSITASDESTGSAEQLTGLIEVNADIQAGDSGGPLLTTSGQVIGVDTAASAGFQYQSAGGDGYAIPIATATAIADKIQNGKASSVIHLGATAYLGIETTSSRAYAGATGPVVLGVVDGSPAETAGLTRGDVITSVAGTKTASATALTDTLDRYHPGDKVKLAWTDVSGQSHSGTVKLTTGPVG